MSDFWKKYKYVFKYEEQKRMAENIYLYTGIGKSELFRYFFEKERKSAEEHIVPETVLQHIVDRHMTFNTTDMVREAYKNGKPQAIFLDIDGSAMGINGLKRTIIDVITREKNMIKIVESFTELNKNRLELTCSNTKGFLVGKGINNRGELVNTSMLKIILLKDEDSPVGFTLDNIFPDVSAGRIELTKEKVIETFKLSDAIVKRYEKAQEKRTERIMQKKFGDIELRRINERLFSNIELYKDIVDLLQSGDEDSLDSAYEKLVNDPDHPKADHLSRRDANLINSRIASASKALGADFDDDLSL